MSLDPWDQITADLPPDYGIPLEERLALEQAATEALETHDEPRGHSWRDQDLTVTITAVAAGTYERPTPDYGQILGALALFYAGLVHLVFGIGGALKTWLAAYVIAERLLAGEHVVFVDLEDRPETLIARLHLDLGVPVSVIAAQLHYKRPTEPSPHGRDELLATVREHDVTLVVVDSLGESLAADGINPNADEEVAVWARSVARAVADQGAAVVLLDHLPKSDEMALTPIGSQRKQAAINGAAYAMRIIKSPSKERAGHVNIVCGKDRQGAYARGEVVAELHLEPRGDGRATITLRAPEARPLNPDGTFRPTVLMERVSQYVQMHPDATTNAITTGVQGKRAAVSSALDILVTEGYILRRTGANNSQLHTSHRVYLRDALEGRTRRLRTLPPRGRTRDAPGTHREPCAKCAAKRWRLMTAPACTSPARWRHERQVLLQAKRCTQRTHRSPDPWRMRGLRRVPDRRANRTRRLPAQRAPRRVVPDLPEHRRRAGRCLVNKWHDSPTMPKQLAPDWASLQELLDRYPFATIPCRVSQVPELWTSTEPHEQSAAAEACDGCPAIKQCRAYGLAHSKELGVYGGLTTTQRQATR